MKIKDTRITKRGRITIWTSFEALHALVIVFLLLGSIMATVATASDLGLTEADCRCCHGATLADRHHLMVIDRGFECLKCHQMTWNQTTVQYDVTVTRDCPQCHTGSLADRHHLLVDQVTYNCFTCHTIAWDEDALMYVAQFNNNCGSSSQNTSPLSATINGTVTDNLGSGLAWAQVATNSADYTTLTTDTGVFQLAEIPAGDYLLTASADGYISASKSVTVTENQTMTIDLVLSPTITPPSITGLVMDSTQAPVEAAQVYSNDGLFTVLTDVDGTFTLPNLAVGDLTLTAERDGYGSSTQVLAVAEGEMLTAEFILPDLPLEVCGDTLDNDRNGFADCDDLACESTAACRGPLEVCGDGLDNDANGLIDCGDLACMETAGCQQASSEICNDDVDNDNDNLVDCEDPACSAVTHCLAETCSDGIDNNGDTLVDCEDPVCTDTSKCLSPPVEICDDGIDNDTDGHFDCADDKCSSKPVCLQPGDDENPGSDACEYIVQNEWASGFTAVIRIDNKGDTPINGWSVNWDYTDSSTIETAWNTDLSGVNPYAASSLNWNAVIYPGQSVDVGLLGVKPPAPSAKTPVVTGPECNGNGALVCEYIVQGEWNTGFNAAIRLYNGSDVPVQGWEVDWVYTDGSTIKQSWSVNLSGTNPYKAKNLDWNRIIEPHKSVTFGVIGQKKEVSAQVPSVTGEICGTLP